MNKKVILLILWIVMTIISGYAIWKFDECDYGLGEAIAGFLIALFGDNVKLSAQDISDTTNWKVSQRKLKRGGFINNDTIIRISFAYLYRIKVGNKYLLVQNSRKTGKFQPVGGVYKLTGDEKLELRNTFHVMDDNKIQIDKSSRDDYRLRMKNKYLRRFVKRFNEKADRERIDNITREFKEELIDTGILNWTQLQYRYCGRHMTDLKWGDHFQIYELLLADVVELIPSQEQQKDLQELINNQSDRYRFATAEQISCLGIDVESGDLHEWIGDHTKKILQENESDLLRVEGVGVIYTVNI